MNYVGYIEKLNTKTGVGKRGPWTLYSVKINDAWVSCGFNPPPFAEGQYVSFDTVTKNVKGQDQQDLLPATVKQVAAPKQTASASQPDAGKAITPTQQAITYQASRNAAIEAVKLLLTFEGLPLPAKAKRNETDVYEIIVAAIDKLTVEYYFDTVTLRKLESVQDAGALEEPEDAAADDATDKDAA